MFLLPALEGVPQLALCHITSGITGEPQRTGQALTDQGIAQRHQNQRQRVFMHFAVFMPAFADIVDQPVNRLNDRVQRIFIAGEHHPGPECRSPLFVKRVKGEIDDVSDGPFSTAGFHDRLRDHTAYLVGQISRERLLQS